MSAVHPWRRRLAETDPIGRCGRVTRIQQTAIEADGPDVPLGTICAIGPGREGGDHALAEVVRVDADRILLSPFASLRAVASGAMVRARQTAPDVIAGEGLLGRAIDGVGCPIDGGTPPWGDLHPLHAPLPSPLERSSPTEVFATRLRAVDGLLTLAKGQRIGIFAASGVGKTSLLTQIARQADADVLILCLIGERGREVEAFWNDGLAPGTRARATLVAATSDQAPALRVRAGYHALALANYWRSRGRHALLLMDSVSRLAMAMREIGLAAGEPPTMRGYTPNVFAEIPRIVEGAGALRTGGAITAIMTILSETDEIDDPVSEMMKSLLDGHILLSRTLAERGQLPAIDPVRSISRGAETLRAQTDNARVRQVKAWLGAYEDSRALRESGLYSAGGDRVLDTAVARHDRMAAFLRQGLNEAVELEQTRAALAELTLLEAAA